jgi:hypothetical protein
MDYYIDAQNVVHTSPSAALGDRGRELRGVNAASPISSRRGWSRCVSCGSHFHETQIAAHRSSCQTPALVSRPTARAKKQPVGAPPQAPKPKIEQVGCPACGANLNPENLARHARRIHQSRPIAPAAPPKPAQSPRQMTTQIPGDSLITRHERALATIQQKMLESRLGKTSVPKRTSTPVNRAVNTTAQSLPAPRDATDPLGLRTKCQRCSGFKVATALGIAWFHTLGHSQQKYEAKLSLVHEAGLKGLVPCSYCASFVRDHRLVGHVRNQHGSMRLSRPSSVESHDRPLSRRDRRPINRVSSFVPNGGEVEDEHRDFQAGLGADVRGQARRHFLDASSDGRYSRDQGRFGSHPTHDGYGDEHWS